MEFSKFPKCKNNIPMPQKEIKPTINTEYELFIEFIDFLKHAAKVWKEQNRFDRDKLLEYCQTEFQKKYKEPIEKILQSKGV